MEAQEENVLWRAKAKQNKTVTTKHMKTIKKKLFICYLAEFVINK